MGVQCGFHFGHALRGPGLCPVVNGYRYLDAGGLTAEERVQIGAALDGTVHNSSVERLLITGRRSTETPRLPGPRRFTGVFLLGYWWFTR